MQDAASFALGRICASNPGMYFPPVLAEVKKPDVFTFLLLQAIKETVTSATGVEPFLGQLLPVLMDLASTRNKDTSADALRDVIGQCLGNLAVAMPGKFAHKLLGFPHQPSEPIPQLVDNGA